MPQFYFLYKSKDAIKNQRKTISFQLNERKFASDMKILPFYISKVGRLSKQSIDFHCSTLRLFNQTKTYSLYKKSS